VAALEERETALKARERDIKTRERRLRLAAEGTVAALHGAQPAASEPAAPEDASPELTFSEGIQALARRRRRQGTARP
jgi:hypothetical protein